MVRPACMLHAKQTVLSVLALIRYKKKEINNESCQGYYRVDWEYAVSSVEQSFCRQQGHRAGETGRLQPECERERSYRGQHDYGGRAGWKNSSRQDCAH